MKSWLAEWAGTFALVLAGTGACIVHELHPEMLSPAGVAIVFGLVVMILIDCLGDISGAHLNPAVTIGLAVAGRFALRKAPAYLLAQLLGALAASALLRALFPDSGKLGATLPLGGAAQAFVLEMLLTWFLVWVILSVTDVNRAKPIAVSLVVGAVIGMEALFAGPITGASMNPARSLAPALVSGHLEHLWIYLTAPCAGALLAVPFCRLTRKPGCCQ